MNTEPFSGRSFVVFSPSRLRRIYTTISPTKILLTAQSQTHNKIIKEGVFVGLTVDDAPTISIGMPLISLGIPVFGIITAITVCPSPLDKDTLRVIINYHPLPKPNIAK